MAGNQLSRQYVLYPYTAHAHTHCNVLLLLFKYRPISFSRKVSKSKVKAGPTGAIMSSMVYVAGRVSIVLRITTGYCPAGCLPSTCLRPWKRATLSASKQQRIVGQGDLWGCLRVDRLFIIEYRYVRTSCEYLTQARKRTYATRSSKAPLVYLL